MNSIDSLGVVPPASTGTFIVIEGTDGSGKSTQYEQLYQNLIGNGYAVERIHFPRYDEPSSYFVREYLQGNYGSADEVGPYTASLFYALDRYQASIQINQWLAEGKVVICDRFTGANMAHQGAKFDNAEQRRGYFIWLDNVEFEMLKIPRPALTIVLNTPLPVVLERLGAKTESSTAVKKDVHEADEDHIGRSLEVYLDLCQLFPKDFTRIDTRRGSELLDIETIARLVYEKVEPLLPQITANQPSLAAVEEAPPSQSVKTEANTNPYIDKQSGKTVATEEGQRYLEQTVTDTQGSVYCFTDAISPMTVAAAMARLSRRGDDMRITLLDEFAQAAGKDAQLLHRVITAYGDDSVQQLVGIPFVVEDASQLLTKKLEWGRLASYLEQSTRYIYYDEKDANGHYKYLTPSHFDPATTKAYEQTMDDIFNRYSVLVRALTTYVREQSSTPEAERDIAWKGATRAQACDAARAVLPVATKSTVGIFASGQALESLIMHLQSDELPEARQTGDSILREARKVVATFLERADKPERGGATIAYMANTRQAVRQLADTMLPNQHTDATADPVVMTDVWPRNELDIVADILYEHSELPLRSLRDMVDGWGYDQKAQVLVAYCGERLNRRHKPGRALEKIHYSWDLVCDYGIFRDLQRHRMVDDLEWQALTPRHGYEVPKLVDDAGQTDLFEECFDLSLQLYSLLQQNGYANEAQYATLLGHRMRWKVTYNAREAFHLHELRTSPQGHPGYRKLVSQMHDKLANVHPLLAEAMLFVNQGEDAELTRLAAERYTQFKLQQLGGDSQQH